MQRRALLKSILPAAAAAQHLGAEADLPWGGPVLDTHLHTMEGYSINPAPLVELGEQLGQRRPAGQDTRLVVHPGAQHDLSSARWRIEFSGAILQPIDRFDILRV
jgi:hypothetical protein